MQTIKLNETGSGRRCIPVALFNTDGTPALNVEIIPGDLKISKGGNGGEANHAGQLIQFARGDYYYEPAASELDTLGILRGRIEKTGIQVFRFAVQVVAVDPYTLNNFGIIESGVAQTVTGSSITLSGSSTLETDSIIGCAIFIRSAQTGAKQTLTVTHYNATTKIAQLDPSWTIIPTGPTIEYDVYAGAPAGFTSLPAVNVANISQIWQQVISGSTSAMEIMRALAATHMGLSTGHETNTPRYRDIADTKNVIDAVIDDHGNRLTIIRDLT
jgi:hypothetical protein